jgi:integrating conjugative element protein (TIGR03756 family)
VPKICHYLPDVVVSVHHRSEQNPWVEMSPLSAAARDVSSTLMGLLIDGGTRSEGDGEREDKGMALNEVSVIGHPMARAAPFGLPLCRSQALLFRPYLLTQLDAWAWRTGLTEVIYPETFIPGLREIGSWPINTWGSVHPRIGSVVQTEEPKAAAVAAQRGVDIITRTGQPHVYQALTGDTGRGQFPPGPSNELTDRWQMLTPLTQGSCETFGSNDPLWSSDKVADNGGYAWNYWRKYQCCIGGRGRLLLHVGDCPDAPAEP